MHRPQRLSVLERRLGPQVGHKPHGELGKVRGWCGCVCRGKRTCPLAKGLGRQFVCPACGIPGAAQPAAAGRPARRAPHTRRPTCRPIRHTAAMPRKLWGLYRLAIGGRARSWLRHTADRPPATQTTARLWHNQWMILDCGLRGRTEAAVFYEPRRCGREGREGRRRRVLLLAPRLAAHLLMPWTTGARYASSASLMSTGKASTISTGCLGARLGGWVGGWLAGWTGGWVERGVGAQPVGVCWLLSCAMRWSYSFVTNPRDDGCSSRCWLSHGCWHATAACDCKPASPPALTPCLHGCAACPPPSAAERTRVPAPTRRLVCKAAVGAASELSGAAHAARSSPVEQAAGVDAAVRAHVGPRRHATQHS